MMRKNALYPFAVMSKMRFAFFYDDKKFCVVFFVVIKNSAQNLHFSQIYIFYKFTLF